MNIFRTCFNLPMFEWTKFWLHTIPYQEMHLLEHYTIVVLDFFRLKETKSKNVFDNPLQRFLLWKHQDFYVNMNTNEEKSSNLKSYFQNFIKIYCLILLYKIILSYMYQLKNTSLQKLHLITCEQFLSSFNNFQNNLCEYYLNFYHIKITPHKVWITLT